VKSRRGRPDQSIAARLPAFQPESPSDLAQVLQIAPEFLGVLGHVAGAAIDRRVFALRSHDRTHASIVLSSSLPICRFNRSSLPASASNDRRPAF
jgi:hypothetical protein